MAELLYKLKRLGHIKLAIVFVTLNILDNALTHIGLNAGFRELNPVMASLWKRGAGMAWSIDIAASLAIALLLVLLTSYSPRLMKGVFIISIIYMAAVCFWNGFWLFN